jgi:serine/threonine protein phosphatase PrpC
MTPPRMPGHESDGTIDMTPTYAPEGEPDEIVEMTPDDIEVGEPEEAMDMSPAYTPEDEERELEAMTPALPQARPPAPSTSRGRTPPRTPAQPQATPPKGKGDRLKKYLIVAAGLVLVALVGKVLGQSIGSGLGGANSASQSTASPVTNTPTPATVRIGNNTVVTTPGPLILLNPGVVRQGTSVGVTGSGFDAGSVIDLTIKRQGATKALTTSFIQAGKGGTFDGGSLNVPNSLSSGNFIVEAKQRNSQHVAQAVGTIAGGAPTVKLGMQVGKPGDAVVLSLHGFAPSENINVYWNSLSGQPVTTLHADGGGGVGQAKVQVPFGAVGNNTFLFVGTTSQSLVAASFLMLQLYPTVKLGSYALKADNVMSFSGVGFGPGERVFVFLNSTMGSPLAVITTDANGSFKNAAGFLVPFEISGKQTLIFVGEQSRAPDAVAFTVLPYAPVVQPSTYGGFPGTTITFYASGFARNEVVHVYSGHTKGNLGSMVSCFQTNDKGAAAAVGSYLIPGDAQGAVGFALVGARSGGVGVASINVGAPPSPVRTPPQARFTCPLDPLPPSSQSTQTPGSSSPPNTATPVPPVPRADLTTPGEHAAPQRVAAASAAIPQVTRSPLPVAQMSVFAFGDEVADLNSDTPRRILWNLLDQLQISPFMAEVGLLWLFLVVLLAMNVVHRSFRQEAKNREASGEDPDVARSSSAALVSTSTVRIEESAGDTAPPSTAAGGGGGLVEARTQLPEANARYQPGDGRRTETMPAKRLRSAASVQAARCMATWHADGRQLGHDATFVQTNVKLASGDAEFGLFLLADGTSGEHSGVTASQVAVEHIARRVISAMTNGTGVPANLIRPLFKYAVMQAGDTLLAQNASRHTTMSTTLTGALIASERAYVVNVGNSRTYLFSPENGLWQLTKDHSVAFGMVSAGLLCPAALDLSAYTQQLYRSLGNADQPVHVDTYNVAIRRGDWLLLCSDGLWQRVSDSRIEAILRSRSDAREAAQALIREAGDSGGCEDDMSAIVVRIHDGDAGYAGPQPGTGVLS